MSDGPLGVRTACILSSGGICRSISVLLSDVGPRNASIAGARVASSFFSMSNKNFPVQDPRVRKKTLLCSSQLGSLLVGTDHCVLIDRKERAVVPVPRCPSSLD